VFSHDKVYVKEIIEDPAFGDKWVSEYVSDTDGINIARCRKLGDAVELDRGRNEPLVSKSLRI